MRFDSRLMEEKLKRGWTVNDFARHLGITEEEFLSLFERKFYGKAYTDLLSRLEKNAEKKKRHPVKEPIPKVEKQKKEVQVKPEIEEKQPSKTPLMLLKDQENDLKNVICRKEVDHKNLVNQKRKLEDSLREQKNLMLDLKRMIEECKREVETIINNLEKVSETLAGVSDEITKFRKDLAKLQNEIQLLSKISIFVYRDGEIETENLEIEISESWKDLFSKIINNEAIEDLTLKQTKQLAKVITLARDLKHKELDFDISFELDLVQELYDKFLYF